MLVNLKICLLSALILAILDFHFVSTANKKKENNPNQLCTRAYFLKSKPGTPVFVRYTIHSDEEVKGKYISNVVVRSRIKNKGKKNTLKRGPRIERNKFKHDGDGSRYFLKFSLPESKSYFFCYHVKSEKGFENFIEWPQVEFEVQLYPFGINPNIALRDDSVKNYFEISKSKKSKKTTTTTTTTQRTPVDDIPPSQTTCFPLSYHRRLVGPTIYVRYYVYGDFIGKYISKVSINEIIQRREIRRNKFNHATNQWLFFDFPKPKTSELVIICSEISYNEDYNKDVAGNPKIFFQYDSKPFPLQREVESIYLQKN